MSEMPRPDRIAISVDITPDQSASTIAIGGLLRQVREVRDAVTGDVARIRLCAVEIGSDGRFDDHRAGTAWLLPRLKALAARNRVCRLVNDPAGPGVELVSDCQKDHRLEVLLEVVKLRDVAEAHAQFLRGVEDRTIVHAGQPDLNRAVACAVQRDVGDGQHAWARKDTEADISPLCSVTMAAWAARKFGGGYDVLKSVI